MHVSSILVPAKYAPITGAELLRSRLKPTYSSAKT
jgi:hypothetical protein